MSTSKERVYSPDEIMPCLGDSFHPTEGEPVPVDLIGAKILRFGGMSKESDIEGGGLGIVYQPAGSDEVLFAVFSFCELGMNVESIRSV